MFVYYTEKNVWKGVAQESAFAYFCEWNLFFILFFRKKRGFIPLYELSVYDEEENKLSFLYLFIPIAGITLLIYTYLNSIALY